MATAAVAGALLEVQTQQLRVSCLGARGARLPAVDPEGLGFSFCQPFME